MGKKTGVECKMYFSATALTAKYTGGTGTTWAELKEVKDVNINEERGEADVTTRANDGYKATIPTLKDASIEFDMPVDTSDNGYKALQAAYDSGDPIAIAAMDGPIDTAGSQGVVGNFSVLNMQRKEPLEDAVTVSVTMKPRSFMSRYTVASGS